MSDSADTKQCFNCKLEILSSNFTVHSVHCQRNFYLCPQCEQPVNYNNKIEHEKANHVVIHCNNCQLELQKYLLEDHLINGCPYRKVKCQICDIEVKATDITEHENYCGSRTEKCSECGEFVMLKYKLLHIDSNHTFVKLSDEPGPSPSWQYGQRTLCNFLPDLSSKTESCKPLLIHKTKLNEDKRRFRHSGSSESKDNSDEINKKNIDSLNCKKEDSQFDNKMCNAFDVRDIKKTIRKDADEWPALSSLRSLHISERSDIPTGAQASNSQQVDEESDLMYAIQVSQEINSDVWKKEITKEDEALKNCFKPSVQYESAEKFFKKNMFDKNPKKIKDEFRADAFKNDFNYLYDKHEIVKLPCEFCGNLIVSNDLFLHQSRCSLYRDERYNLSSERYKMPYYDDMEKKIACGICNKFFRLSLLENHQIHCQKNSGKSMKYRVSSSKNLKAMNMKCEQGLQNGLEASSPQLTRMGTRSEWFSELSKSNEGGRDIQNNLNHPEPSKGVVAKTTKVSRKNRRAPSPPRRNGGEWLDLLRATAEHAKSTSKHKQ